MNTSENRGPPWQFLGALIAAAFGLNWLWEMAQMPAYVEMAGRSWRETAPTCALAALGDVAITVAVWGLGALAASRWQWGVDGAWNVYATTVLLGGALAAAVEWRARAWGHWSYNERMPVVPGLGVGLWPLLQLVLLVPACFAVASWWAGRADRQKHRANGPHGGWA